MLTNETLYRIGGTHSFFEYADDPTYSYLEQATKRGNAVVSYDRLGAQRLFLYT